MWQVRWSQIWHLSWWKPHLMCSLCTVPSEPQPVCPARRCSARQVCPLDQAAGTWALVFGSPAILAAVLRSSAGPSPCTVPSYEAPSGSPETPGPGAAAPPGSAHDLQAVAAATIPGDDNLASGLTGDLSESAFNQIMLWVRLAIARLQEHALTL